MALTAALTGTPVLFKDKNKNNILMYTNAQYVIMDDGKTVLERISQLLGHTHNCIMGANDKIAVATGNDYAGLVKFNNTNVSTGWGFSVCPSITGQIIPKDTPAFSIDARNGNVYIAGILYTPNGKQGVQLGDDITLGDCNEADTMSLQGVENSTVAHIQFGSNKNTKLSSKNNGNLYLNDKKLLTQTDYDTLFNYGNDIKQKLVDALIAKGISASTSESFDSLFNKLNNLQMSHTVDSYSIVQVSQADYNYPSYGNIQAFLSKRPNTSDQFYAVDASGKLYIFYSSVMGLVDTGKTVTYSSKSQPFTIGNYNYYGNGKYDLDWNLVSEIWTNSYKRSLDPTKWWYSEEFGSSLNINGAGYGVAGYPIAVLGDCVISCESIDAANDYMKIHYKNVVTGETGVMHTLTDNSLEWSVTYDTANNCAIITYQLSETSSDGDDKWYLLYKYTLNGTGVVAWNVYSSNSYEQTSYFTVLDYCYCDNQYISPANGFIADFAYITKAGRPTINAIGGLPGAIIGISNGYIYTNEYKNSGFGSKIYKFKM